MCEGDVGEIALILWAFLTPKVAFYDVSAVHTLALFPRESMSCLIHAFQVEREAEGYRDLLVSNTDGTGSRDGQCVRWQPEYTTN